MNEDLKIGDLLFGHVVLLTAPYLGPRMPQPQRF